MAEIFICKPGAIGAEDRTALRDAGVVVIELDDPAEFRLVRAQPELNAGDILKAALQALSPDADDAYHPATTNRSIFLRALAKAVTSRSEGEAS